MDFSHWTPINTWFTSGVGLVVGGFFYKRFSDVMTGASTELGAFVFKHVPFLNRRKTRSKGSDAQMIKIAQLSQKVTDLTITVKAVVKKLNKTEKRLEDCQSERTECRADMKNLLFRIEKLESKKGIN